MEIGLEKEFLLFDNKFKPVPFKAKELPEGMTLDYADHQIELVSTVHPDVSSLYKEMYELLDNPIFNNYKMWPLSQPDSFTKNITLLGTTGKAKKYRDNLSKKYDQQMLLLSGIHLNIDLFDKMQNNGALQFELFKKLYVYMPLLLQFVSFTPCLGPRKGLNKCRHNYGLKDSISLRNSEKYGYYNEHILELDFESLSAFEASKQALIENGSIQNSQELYSRIRIKKNKNNYYLELRFFDLNPFDRLGIKKDMLEFIIVLIEKINAITTVEFDYKLALSNFEKVATKGYNQNMKIEFNNKTNTLKHHTNQLFKLLTVKEKKKFKQIIKNYNNKDSDNYRIKLLLEEKKINDFGKQYYFQKEQFSPIDNHPSLELSSQILIKEAKKQKLKVKILDGPNNVIQIEDQIIVQATKTKLDKYVDVLMMDNKYMTKKILANEKIKVPRGIRIVQGEEIDYSIFIKKAMVIKPLDTNFGLGITMLTINPSKEVIDKALTDAFKHSNQILIEALIKGKEYRFLVIGNKCVSIIHRTPAHINGDGKKTIKQLVDIKNKNPLRGEGYKKPLEKIKLDTFEINYLQKFGYQPSSVVNKGEIVYLRPNSNVSMGGETWEVFDHIDEKFHKIAVDATKALNIKISGVDMIIDENNKYSIIEVNYNPAIHMHTYPLLGFGKNPAYDILKLLFPKQL